MTRKGVWNLQQTRDKYLQSLWANDFHLYGWGYNADGTVGNNTRSTTRFSSPIQIGTGTNWSSVSGKQAYYSEYYRLQTKTDGTLWSWGRNDRGQLGLNTADDKRSSPTQIPGTTWTSNLSIGYRSSSCIKTDGTLWTWGQGYYGMLGLNQTANLKFSSPVQVPGTTWSKAYLGSTAAGGIKTDGTLWMWGSNSYGQLAQNSILNSPGYSSPVQVGSDTTWSTAHAGEKHVAAIKTDGTLWTWGLNNAGQMAINNVTAGYSSPVQVGSNTNWSDVWTNITNGAAITTDGELFLWGSNANGKLGQNQGPALDVASSPIQISGTTWKQFIWINYGGWQAIKTDGTLWGCGRLNHGNALDENMDLSSPVQLGSDSTWDSVGSWAYGTVALKGTLTPSQL